MNSRITIVLTLAIALMAGLVGCGGGDEYIIKDLKLPAGSTVKSCSNSEDASGMTFAGSEAFGDVEEAVAVMFDCSLDWQAISSHFDGYMQRAGMTDNTSILTSVAGMGLPAEAVKMFSGTMKMWASDDGVYFAQLVNNAAVHSMGRGMIPPTLGDTDYTLVVLKCKPGGGKFGRNSPTGLSGR